MTDSQEDLYKDCISKQLEEIDMLSSIYCTAGEMTITDPSIIADFTDYQQQSAKNAHSDLKAHLDFTLKLSIKNSEDDIEKLEINIELPHLYPVLENAIIRINNTSLRRLTEQHLNQATNDYIATLEKGDAYIYQVITWIQEEFEKLLISEKETSMETESIAYDDEVIDLERLWIASHHIKSKTKRHEILKQSHQLNLSGFLRPGKPGFICVEGERENTQNFWRIIKAMCWQKISIAKSEVSHKPRKKLNKFRRFDGMKEQLFYQEEDNTNGESIMNMSAFLKYLEEHNSGYMKKELFGFDN